MTTAATRPSTDQPPAAPAPSVEAGPPVVSEQLSAQAAPGPIPAGAPVEAAVPFGTAVGGPPSADSTALLPAADSPATTSALPAVQTATPPVGVAPPAAAQSSSPIDLTALLPDIEQAQTAAGGAQTAPMGVRAGTASAAGTGTAGAASPPQLSQIEARAVSAWFGAHKVLEKVSLTMPAGQVTALIGPSGCGKSTFLRILNRLHELVPGASMAGEVLLDGQDVYDRSHKIQEARKDIGMVFQRPNPFPAMSIYDNVLAGLKLTGRHVSHVLQDRIVETSLARAGLWAEVKDRLRQPGGSLSGGQQQRLCIARSLAVKPKVLLMDEPCSALDPTSTRVIEETMAELQKEVTIVIVTHNMQQAQRVSQQCAFFLATQGTPGVIVEHGETEAIFNQPRDQRTADYVNGRFG
jgi:phosphate ABC transporter ATP-binding protein